MNIVQLHERVRFWVDIVSSTRFEAEDIDNALNISIENKTRESYDQNRPMNRSDSFQRVQRVRDELGALVKKFSNTTGFSCANNEITFTSEWRYLLALKVKLGNSGWHPTFPMTYDRRNVVERNPFRRVRMTPNSKVYYNEENSKIVITHNFPDDVSDIEMHYLANPAIVRYGIESTGPVSFSSGTYVIATTPGTSYSNQIGDKILMTTPYNNIYTGTVVSAFTECDLKASTHEEIARRAAMNCLMTAGEVEKVNSLRQEIMAS